MTEEGAGEKWTCCLPSEVVLEADEQEVLRLPPEQKEEGGAEREGTKEGPTRAALCAA